VYVRMGVNLQRMENANVLKEYSFTKYLLLMYLIVFLALTVVTVVHS
jgi:hypothetical protein